MTVENCLKKLPLKFAYDSDEDDILEEFFIPVLSRAKRYRRVAGFFSSNVLAVAARGVANLIRNEGTMELVCGARLSEADVTAIREGLSRPDEVIGKGLAQDLTGIDDELVRDHVAALGWMVAKRSLKIKVAVVLDRRGNLSAFPEVSAGALFHQKVGIVEDACGHAVSFSGSDNESAQGWRTHIEEVKVFKGWEPSQLPFFQSDVVKVSKFWDNRGGRTRVLDIPRAVEEFLITFAPRDLSNLRLPSWPVSRTVPPRRAPLWPHQAEAVEEWCRNNHMGIFEMATGTGKTRAALECVRYVFSGQSRALAVISSPYSHLLRQFLAMFTSSNSSMRWRKSCTSTVASVSDIACLIRSFTFDAIIYVPIPSFRSNSWRRSRQSMRLRASLANSM